MNNLVERKKIYMLLRLTCSFLSNPVLLYFKFIGITDTEEDRVWLILCVLCHVDSLNC